MERSYVAKATQPRRRILQSRILFHDIGKFSLSYIIKSALRSDAHSHERQMSAKADHARRSKSVLLGRKWNRKGVRSTLLLYGDACLASVGNDNIFAEKAQEFRCQKQEIHAIMSKSEQAQLAW